MYCRMDIRSAEKDRISTCALADNVAKAVIAKYTESAPAGNAQGVLAGIVAVCPNGQTEVISIGYGNKFIPSNLQSQNTNGLKDCHAEILARRAFKLWLINQASQIGDRNSYFERTVEGKLRPLVEFILYVSSAPCGNACIRRWGKSDKEVYTLDKFIDIHEEFFAHAKSQGQTAISYKSDKVLSCSDKILKWSVLGIQGTRLSGSVSVYLSGIVIGRKFVRKHAMRAFCCRLNTKNVNPIIRNALVHPALMCSAVKFDEGTFQGGQGATFDSKALWYALPDIWEHLDGSTGMCVNGRVSLLRNMNSFSNVAPEESQLATLLALELDRLYACDLRFSVYLIMCILVLCV